MQRPIFYIVIQYMHRMYGISKVSISQTPIINAYLYILTMNASFGYFHVWESPLSSSFSIRPSTFDLNVIGIDSI